MSSDRGRPLSLVHGAAVMLLSLACSSAADRRAAAAAPAPPGRIDALLAQMTLEEKAGQLTQWGAQLTPTGPRVHQGGEDDIRQGRVGSLLGAFGVEATHRLQKIAADALEFLGADESIDHVELLLWLERDDEARSIATRRGYGYVIAGLDHWAMRDRFDEREPEPYIASA